MDSQRGAVDKDKLHIVEPGESGEGDDFVAVVQTEAEQLVALQARVVAQDQQIAYVLRRLTTIETALSGVTAATSTVMLPDESPVNGELDHEDEQRGS